MGVEAYNRRDLDVVVLGYDPALEYYPYYRGPAGYRRYIESTNDVIELIDLGPRGSTRRHAHASAGERISLADAGVWDTGEGRPHRPPGGLSEPREALAVVGSVEKT